MARDKAVQAEDAAWQRAARDMRTALIGFAKEKDFAADLGQALGLFWQDRYTLDTVHQMSVDESLRFFDWFALDYALRHTAPPEATEAGDPEGEQEGTGWLRNGKTLIRVYRHEVDDALSDKEAAILDGWIDSPPGSAFVLQEADPAQGTVVLQDLLLAERLVTVQDHAAAKHGEVGQILLCRPLPERDRLRLSGATVVLPAEEREGLLGSVEEEHQAYLAGQEPGSKEPYSQFLRARAYRLTHYALEWADRESRPAVASQDPDAHKPGDKAMQKLVRWRQERTQVHR